MRIRVLAVATLLVLPSVMAAQLRRIPVRTGQEPEPVALPPAIPAVQRDMSLKQARWSVEAYSLMSTLRLPVEGGGMSNLTLFGAGTHGNFRLNDRVSTTFDITYSPLGGNSARSETAELGMRYTTPAWDRGVRAYFDGRAGYISLRDLWSAPTGANPMGDEYVRSSWGVGGIGGAGLEMPISRRIGVSTGLTAMRNLMLASRVSGPSAVPSGERYWMTSLRWAIAVRWSPTAGARE